MTTNIQPSHTQERVIFIGKPNTGRTTQAIKLALKTMEDNPGTPENIGKLVIFSYDSSFDALVSLIQKELNITDPRILRIYLNDLNYNLVMAHYDYRYGFDQDKYIAEQFKDVSGPKIMVEDAISDISRLAAFEGLLYISTLNGKLPATPAPLRPYTVYETKVDAGKFTCAEVDPASLA